MTALVSRILRGTLLAMLFSVLAGGLLLWLSANGLDLQKNLAGLLRLAQKPEYRHYTLPASAALSFCVLSFLIYVARRMNRPPRATTLSLRRAAVVLQQKVFVAIPDKDDAENACRSFEQLLHEVEPFETTARHVREILNLANSYLLGIAQKEDQLAPLQDRAIDAVDKLMRATLWAVEDPGNAV